MGRFDSFVIIAEMRTGSNFLEENLNQFDGLECHGEAFNSAFVGQHNWTDLFGMTLAQRDADPLELLNRIRDRSVGLGGFRYFCEHDPRVLDAILPDPRVAKVILTRNPLDSYVSREIARKTGQWRLTDEKHRKTARIRFEPAAFEAQHQSSQRFRSRIRRSLQVTGQTPFDLRYEDVGDLDVLNGLATFLGVRERISAISTRLKRQNPAALSDKVENFDEMQRFLGETNVGGLGFGGDCEPLHDAAVPTFVAAPDTPLMFLPIKGGPTERIERWLAALDGVDRSALLRGFTRKTLRQWKNHNKDSRGFTVVCHPVERAFNVFERHIVQTGPECFAQIRRHLIQDHALPLPSAPDDPFDRSSQRAAFLGFLKFVKRNLAGQTRQRTDPAWSSQVSLLQSLSAVLAPDMVLRQDRLALGLEQLCTQIGMDSAPAPVDESTTPNLRLDAIYNDEIEAATRGAYNRDFTAFGFRRWKT